MMKTCEICGLEVERGARQCHRCSNWFDEATWATPERGTCLTCGKVFAPRGLHVHMRVHNDE